MNQKIIFISIFFSFFFIALLIIKEIKNSKPDVNLEKIEEKFLKLPEKEDLTNPIIEILNEKNKSIENFYSKDIQIKIWENGHRYKLTGEIAYVKPSNFYMSIDSIFGKEVEIGSNEKEFWYWSRRDKNPALYWSYNEDFNKTRLKTPFNPIFMKSTLGLESLDLSDTKFFENEKGIMITYSRFDSVGRPILYSVFVDKNEKVINGFLITNLEGDKLVECFIEKRNELIPLKVYYVWHEENRIMSLEFKKSKFNLKLNNDYFIMPDIYPKINMADQ
jgi:hypothetical protein